MSRAEEAHATMCEILIDCRKKNMTPEQTAKAIDAGYPFGDRSQWPYRAWLRERKVFFANHGLPRNGDYRDAKIRQDDLVSKMQCDFDEAKATSSPECQC